MASNWTTEDIPDQTGRVAIVTGANSGLGLVTARELARAGAEVVIACRSVDKGTHAAAQISAVLPAAKLLVRRLDLADLASVRAFAARVAGERPQIDLLVNNAGVMAPPRRSTKEGFESQLATNHLGHFALTGLLLGSLFGAPQPRVVTLSSAAHRMGTINFNDLQSEHGYNNWRAYGQSKLANLMFCFELGRRASAGATALRSVAAHPGYAATNLQFAGPSAWYERALMVLANKTVAQSAAMGALPSLYAATEPDLPGGSFIGPGGPREIRGYPRIVTAAPKAYDEDAWRRLWSASEELTGVRYRFPVTVPG
ncbi:MAG: oxidoreductase [Actinomycetota bacterium]|nr:oxidoreductase [Actinomycetota bacterium]